MKLNKTETKLLERMKHSKYSRTSVFGNREVQAAKKLADKGLATFTNQSDLVRNCIRQQNGDYRSVFVYQGYLEEAE